jgi:hypothetical protein
VPLLIRGRATLGRTIGILAFAGLLVAVIINFLHREGPRQTGFRFDNFLEAARPLAWFTAVGTVALFCVGWGYW